ncbi:MAG: pantetheine-phosphate adenylyltransferase [Nitrospirota bacterium]|jgi:pantetheine-phosphate adenylyltransferase
MRLVIYPGTFDPLTLGHLDIVEQAAGIFDRVLVAVAQSAGKAPYLDVEHRVAAAAAAVAPLGNVECESFDGLLVNLVRRRDACAVVRGVRGHGDFEIEQQMALTNRVLAGSLTTCLLIPAPEHLGIASKLVREILSHGGDVSQLVPPAVLPFL